MKENKIVLINKWESTGLKHFNDSNAFIEYSNDMDMCKNTEEYKPSKKCKILIIFDNMIADMPSNKNLKFCALFYYEHSKQMRTYINCIKFLIRYWL